MVAVDDIPSENERVAPIIGVFEHPSPEVAISKKNRSKLRIRRGQERRSDDGQEHKIIIARIN